MQLENLKMAQKSRSLSQMGSYLLVVILFSPREITSSFLTVNGNAENYVLDTERDVDASLECAVHNHVTDEELLWYREEGRVDLESGNKINSSSVCVSSISEDDNGVSFTCKLQSNQTVAVSVVLNVTFPPLLSGNTFLTVREDSDATLVCDVKSNPQAQMTWHRNNSPLVLEENHHQIQQTSESLRLSITKVQKSDNGTYSCIARSPLKTETLDFHLVVEDKVMPVPVEAIIAACVVVLLTLCFALLARREKILKLCIKKKNPGSDTAL